MGHPGTKLTCSKEALSFLPSSWCNQLDEPTPGIFLSQRGPRASWVRLSLQDRQKAGRNLGIGFIDYKRELQSTKLEIHFVAKWFLVTVLAHLEFQRNVFFHAYWQHVYYSMPSNKTKSISIIILVKLQASSLTQVRAHGIAV